jgi:hypothetical protein
MSEIQLPAGWEQYNDSRGRRYFVTTRPVLQSTWVDPLYPINENDPLPRGWDGRYDISMRWCYFNAHTKTVTYEDPRLLRSGPIERLPRGNIPSEIWFYGEVPPAASVAEDPPAYSPPRPGPPTSSIANFTNQLPPIQQTPLVNSGITLPNIESLSLPGHKPLHCLDFLSGAEPLSFLRTSGSSYSTSTATLDRNQRPQDESPSRSNTPAITDASDKERPPQSQVRSSGDQPVTQTSAESDNNQRTPSDEDSTDVQPVFKSSSESNENQWTRESEESADIQPASKFELKNNDDEDWFATCPKNKDFSTSGSPIIAKTPRPTQRRRQKRKRQKNYRLQNNDDDEDSLVIFGKNGDSETGGSSILAKDATPNQSLGEWLKFKNPLEMPVSEAADISSHSKRTPVSEPERNTEPSSDPYVPPEPASDVSLPRYRLIRAYRDPSGTLLYYVLDANCLAEEIAPHYCRLTWNSGGGLHHHAVVDSHPDHVRTSENKLTSFHRGLQYLVDADYLIIDFPNKKERRWEEVNYSDVWADLYRGRIFEDAIRIGSVVKMPCPEGCMIGSVSLAQGDRTEVGEEAARVKPLSMTETKTRISAEEAGLFGHEKLPFRGYKRPTDTGSLSLMATRISADEAGLF